MRWLHCRAAYRLGTLGLDLRLRFLERDVTTCRWDGSPDAGMRFGEGAQGLALTMLLPTLLMIASREGPVCFGQYLESGSAGEPSWIRTSDLLIKSQLLYRLSYGPDHRGPVTARARGGQGAVRGVGGEAAFDPPTGRDCS